MTLIALLVPLLLGAVVWLVLSGRPRSLGESTLMLGASFVLGGALLGVSLRLAHGLPSSGLFGAIAPWLAPALGVAAVAVWRFAPGAAPMDAVGLAHSPWRDGRGLLPLALLGLLFAAIALQACALPTLSWDAWNAWLAKSRAWYHAGSMLPAVDSLSWLEAGPGERVAVSAAHYPESLPRLALWLVSSGEGWSTARVHALWPMLWLALGAMHHGLLLGQGVAHRPALWSTAALLSLPLLATHAALAGYADLWLAAMLLLAGVALERWASRRGLRIGLTLALAVALLPAIKLEGAVWAGCIVGVAMLFSLPVRVRKPVVLMVLLIFVAGLLMGGWTLPIPGLGLVRLTWGEVVVPGLPPMELRWRPVAAQVAQTLWFLPNWGLLWYVAPVLVAVHWRTLRDQTGLRALALLLLLAGGFLFVLFFLTDAAAWAENLTSVNRVLMHVVPLLVYWLTRLWESAPPRTAPPTVD